MDYVSSLHDELRLCLALEEMLDVSQRDDPYDAYPDLRASPVFALVRRWLDYRI